MPRELGAHLGMLMDGIIVVDRVNELSRRHRGLDPVQEAKEFLVAMARHALPDDGAVENIELRAITDVVVGRSTSIPTVMLGNTARRPTSSHAFFTAWGMRTRSCGRGSAPAVGSEKRPSLQPPVTAQARRKRSWMPERTETLMSRRTTWQISLA